MQLNKLQVTSTEPTTIIEDFQQFLMYINQQPIKLTKAKGNLAKKDLRAMYAFLPNFGLEIGESSNQSYYPVINLFMELALKLELIKKVAQGAASVLEVDEEQLAKFEKLTATERYVSLLQCFWLYADWTALQGGLYTSAPDNVDILLSELSEMPLNTKIVLAKEQSLNFLLARYGHFLLHFQYFGFWEVMLDNEIQPKTKVKATSIKIHSFLKPLIPILMASFENRADSYGLGMFGLFIEGFEDDFEEEHEPISTELFISKLQPLFEKGQLKHVLQPKEKVIKHGEYIFKVAHSASCLRTIALHDSHTLLDLHEWIQRAFSFMDDHLYAFYMDNQPFSRNCYNSPMDTQGPFVQDVTIAELYLEEGQQFLYVFDFGDEWHFQVTVEKITEGIENVLPSIRQEKGEAPQQYEDFDWE